MSDFFDSLETRSPEQREAQLMAALCEHIAHAREHSPAYASILKDMDTAQVRSREALAALPVTRKSDLTQLQRQARPFGGFCTAAPPRLTKIFASPGPIYEPETSRPDYWRFGRALYAAGFRGADIIHNCFAYHLTPAGSMFDSGGQALGCAVVAAGPGQTEMQVQTIADIRPSGYTGTPSFLKMLLEKGDETGTDLSCISKALVTGEALPGALRDYFSARNLEVFQCYGTADLGLIAYESPARQGLILDEGVIVEIVRPGSGDPAPDGEVGEVVVTVLNPDYPLIRFATGDLSAVLPGTSPCGRTNTRLKGWMGRADQTTKVRGMFVHPSQVVQVLKRHPELGRARLVVERIGDNDRMTLHAEIAQAPEPLAEALAQSLRDLCKLRGEVLFVPQGSLPNDGKIIHDARPID